MAVRSGEEARFPHGRDTDTDTDTVGDRAAPMVSSSNLSVGASVAGQGYAAWFDLVPSSVSSRSESR